MQNIDLNRLSPDIHINDEFSFFDTHLKINYQLSDKDQVSAAAFYASNNFEDLILDDRRQQAQADTFTPENRGVNLAWKHNWKPNFTTNLNTLYTEYHYDYGYSLLTQGQERPDKRGYKSNVQSCKPIKRKNTG